MRARARVCARVPLPSPDVVVLLDVNLVKHHILLLDVDVSLHLHGNVPGQHRQQQAFLTDRHARQTDRQVERRGAERN